jgi:HAD superfamily hydrolase (TIGR01484 family)
MLPIAELGARMPARPLGVFTDIDDTLTTDGYLPAAAYAALERLQSENIRVVPVTGRPAGWCDMIARFWPVDGVVGENGAFYFRYERGERRMIRRYAVAANIRARDRQRLHELAAQIVATVPGCAVAADQASRLISPRTSARSALRASTQSSRRSWAPGRTRKSRQST